MSNVINYLVPNMYSRGRRDIETPQTRLGDDFREEATGLIDNAGIHSKYESCSTNNYKMLTCYSK